MSETPALLQPPAGGNRITDPEHCQDAIRDPRDILMAIFPLPRYKVGVEANAMRSTLEAGQPPEANAMMHL